MTITFYRHDNEEIKLIDIDADNFGTFVIYYQDEDREDPQLRMIINLLQDQVNNGEHANLIHMIYKTIYDEATDQFIDRLHQVLIN
jgi:hypothetical protein